MNILYINNMGAHKGGGRENLHLFGFSILINLLYDDSEEYEIFQSS